MVIGMLDANSPLRYPFSFDIMLMHKKQFITVLHPWEGKGESGATPFGVNLRGAGVSLPGFGVSPSFFSLPSPPQATSKRRKRGFSGTPRTPQKGGCPFEPAPGSLS